MDLEGKFILDLLFIGELSDLGGTVAVGATENGASGEGVCGDVVCSIQVTQRTITGGSVAIDLDAGTNFDIAASRLIASTATVTIDAAGITVNAGTDGVETIDITGAGALTLTTTGNQDITFAHSP